jgi:hypothetical protein
MQWLEIGDTPNFSRLIKSRITPNANDYGRSLSSDQNHLCLFPMPALVCCQPLKLLDLNCHRHWLLRCDSCIPSAAEDGRSRSCNDANRLQHLPLSNSGPCCSGGPATGHGPLANWLVQLQQQRYRGRPKKQKQLGLFKMDLCLSSLR